MQKGFDYIGVTVVFFCHDGKGNFLMNKRGQNCRDEQGVWDPGGGGVEFGESVEETLKKEILEEYGTEIRDKEFLGYMDIHREIGGRKSHWVGLCFKVLIDPKKARNAEPHKFDEIGWFTLDTLPSPVHSQMANFLKKFEQKLRA